MKVSFKIGDVAKAAHVNVQTVRYYEHLGILMPVSRRLSGYRQYDQKSIERLVFIKKSQALGFRLSEISTLLNLRISKAHQCDSVREKASTKIREVEDKILLLTNIKNTLKELVDHCENRRNTEACPILKSLK